MILWTDDSFRPIYETQLVPTTVINFTGEFQLSACREKVWQALNSIQVLQDAIPGCQDFIQKGENQFQANIHTKLGPVTAKFLTRIKVENIVPLQSYTLVVESSGGAQGIGQGIVNVGLSGDEDLTQLKYALEFKVRGKLAQVGSRLISNGVKKLSNEFFERFAANFKEKDVGS